MTLKTYYVTYLIKGEERSMVVEATDSEAAKNVCKKSLELQGCQDTKVLLSCCAW